MEEQKQENCDSFQERKSESEKGGDSEDYSKFPLSGQKYVKNLQGYGEKEKDSSVTNAPTKYQPKHRRRNRQ